MAKRVVTPENLSKDFELVLGGIGGDPLKVIRLRLNGAHFTRDAITGEISVVGAGAGGLTPAMANLEDVDLSAGLLDGVVLVYDGVAHQWRPEAALTPDAIRIAYESNADRKAFKNADRIKLDSIQSGAQINPTAAEIVTAINAALGGSSLWQGGPIPTQIRAETANYTLVQDDMAGERIIQMNMAASNTVTIPSGLTPNFPVSVMNYGLGQTTIVPASGVTLVSADSARTVRAQYSIATLFPLALNTYLLAGDIIP